MEKYLKNKRIDNTWQVIKINDLPENMPVIGISIYPDKSFASFHMVEYCLVPKSVNLKDVKKQSTKVTDV